MFSFSNVITVFGIILFAAIAFSAEIGSAELSEELKNGKTNLYIMIIWSKMAQLGLGEYSEVEGFRRPK